MPYGEVAKLGYSAFEKLGGVDWAMKRLGLKKDVYDKYMYGYKEKVTGAKSYEVFSLDDGHLFETGAAQEHFLRAKNAKKAHVPGYHVQYIPKAEGLYRGVVVKDGQRWDANLWGVSGYADPKYREDCGVTCGMKYEDIPIAKRQELEKTNETPSADKAPLAKGTGLIVGVGAIIAYLAMK